LTKLNADRIQALEDENARLRYVLGGVAAAIDTGRNEPLVVWREQIEIALIPDTDKGSE
jgi:ribosomal 30S subunit maturation factor RimM